VKCVADFLRHFQPVIAALKPQHRQPMAPPARPADPEVVARKKTQVTPVGPSPSSPPPGDGSNAEQEFVQRQIVKFLRSKDGAPLTQEEYERIMGKLSNMVDDSEHPDLIVVNPYKMFNIFRCAARRYFYS
jgi:hypothetical protein